MELIKQTPNLTLKFAVIFQQYDRDQVYMWPSVPKCEESLDHLGFKSTVMDLLNFKNTKYTW